MAKYWKDTDRSALVNGSLEAAGPRPHAVTITSNGRIAGGSGADQLTGGGGPDILIGHGGADVLTGNGGDDVLMGERTMVRNASLAGVGDFAIIYNGDQQAPYTAIGLRDSNHDLLVINTASAIDTAARDETPWQPTEIGTIKSSGTLVLGYLNVAKINDYTSMWHDDWTTHGSASDPNVAGHAPDFLREDGAAANTRLVDITKPSWIAALHLRIDEMIDQKFDGMFLDDVLGYYTPYHVTLGASARAMRDLIIDLTTYARQQDPDFIVMGNGGPDLIAHTTDDGMAPNPARAALFYASLDAFLAESYFRDPISGHENAYGVQQAILNYGSRGIALFAADQSVPPAQNDAIEHEGDLAGFVPFSIPGDNYGYDFPPFHSTMGDDAAGNDLLYGGAGKDTLIGGGGDDRLDGGADADTMRGGPGDDWYFVDNIGDAIGSEGIGQGTLDRVFTSVSYVLTPGAQIENIATTDHGGTAPINLTGNEFAQILLGNEGANILDGKGGADMMHGRGGNDYYYVDNARDAIGSEGAGQGTLDRVFASVSFVLTAGAQIESVATTNQAGTGAINLTGNEFGQILLGNDGANILDGKGGADIMHGWGGNDYYYIDNIGDQIGSEGAGQGTLDRVFTSVSYVLNAGAQIENIATTNHGGTGAINLTGNEFGQILLGNEGANILDGKGGADILQGRGGADTFAFTTAIGGGNVDAIGDFAHGIDKIALDDARFGGITQAALAGGAFHAGSGAADSGDRIIYNSGSGALFFDPDGTGAMAAIQFATLKAGLALTAADFIVI